MERRGREQVEERTARAVRRRRLERLLLGELRAIDDEKDRVRSLYATADLGAEPTEFGLHGSVHRHPSRNRPSAVARPPPASRPWTASTIR